MAKNSLQTFDGNKLKFEDFKFERTDKGESSSTIKEVSFIGGIYHLLSGRWMQSGGDEVDDLRNRLIVEQSSISLVAALFMTVSISQMFVCDAWNQDWKQGVYGLLINLASAGLVVAVLTSIIFILAVNECNSNSELKRFRSNMGLLLEFPFISFAFGAIMFGGVTLCFWCYRTFTLDW